MTALVMVSALGLASCGSSSTDSSKFVGTWQFTSGTLTINCPGLATSTQAVTGNVTVSAGSTSDLVVVDSQCSLKLTVSGGTASAPPSQMCTTTDATSTEVDTFSAVVFSTADGKTAHLSTTFTAAYTEGGVSETCTATESADLQKL
jgi:hypothetical protein